MEETGEFLLDVLWTLPVGIGLMSLDEDWGGLIRTSAIETSLVLSSSSTGGDKTELRVSSRGGSCGGVFERSTGRDDVTTSEGDWIELLALSGGKS
jgi:hypothetical protein